MKKFNTLFAAVMIGLLLFSGCARDTVVRKETTHTPDGDVIIEEEIVTREKDDGFRDDPSILGAVFFVIGEVVALPFRIVGGAFDLIF
ncbi:MAG: hypothetical protein C4541_12925 [Candidatus Auribacter fodinae]|jgi:hypothetical protein|uniref:YceK/YidQ family lipoprotein n=1 Tax=Candidatus Auribacter fodinae TaxID=2093366 RepID=A0A3A4QTT5_9BACT|nr:MAG: hypothetical protein C4541_12925 [Candidatus Auribacter fodinae]